MAGGQAEEGLARRIAEAVKQVTEEYEEEKAIARRLAEVSYAERLRGFLDENYSTTSPLIGRRSWYARSFPMRLQFHPKDLARWFSDTDDKPCIMPGSMYALRRKYADYYNARVSLWTESVFERQVMRWLRKSRITCLDRNEWARMPYEKFWRERLARLEYRYTDGNGRWSGMDWLARLVTAGVMPYDGRLHGGSVIINGEVHSHVDEERLKILKEMYALGRSIVA